jgi:hypothetical protein
MAGETIFSFTPKTDSSREFWSFGPQPTPAPRDASQQRNGKVLLDNAF